MSVGVSLLPSQEKGREEKQSEINSRIRGALNCGLKVLDEAFEKLEVENTPGEGGHVTIT